MQHISQEKPKQLLFSTIDSLFERKDEFLTNPQSDFTRTKKISFHQTILFPMLAGSDNTATELVNFFEEEKLPMPSAMVQRRSQVRSEAFKELFYSFIAFQTLFLLPKNFKVIRLSPATVHALIFLTTHPIKTVLLSVLRGERALIRYI